MNARFVFSEVGKGLFRNKAMAVSVVLVTFVSLLFVGIAALAQLQVASMRTQWYDRIEVSIYMCGANDLIAACNQQEATDDQIKAVADKLASPQLANYVEEFHQESKDEAYENFQAIYGGTSWAQWMTPEMMQVGFRVKLVDPEQYRFIEEEFTGMPGVAQINDQREILDQLFQIVDHATWMSLGLAGVMTVAAVLLITTTIRLSAMSREKETTIMRYVGASGLTIQLPFMIEGAIAALLGALLAVGALWAGVHVVVNNWLQGSFQWTRFVGVRELLIVSPLLILAAIALAAVASGVSLAKYTKV